jgi:hypothetical protein
METAVTRFDALAYTPGPGRPSKDAVAAAESVIQSWTDVAELASALLARGQAFALDGVLWCGPTVPAALARKIVAVAGNGAKIVETRKHPVTGEALASRQRWLAIPYGPAVQA